MRAQFILAVTAMLLLGLPALSDQSPANLRGAQTDPAGTATEPSADKSAAGTATKRVPFGEKTASFGAGFMVGTPIACVRLGVSNDFEVERRIPLVGKVDNPVFLWTGRAVVYPGCAVVGLFEAPFYAWYKSRTMCGKEPFSKDAFCLGEIEKYAVRCQQ